jgi:F-type H+-transporting ATPase subunit delta
MSEIKVASRYAKSLIDLAEEQHSLEATKADLQMFLRTVKANAELKAILANPIISPDKKVAIIKGVFSAHVSQLTISFLLIMVNKGRAGILYATAKEFINQYNARKNIIKATVTSATPLSEENKKHIIQIIQQSTGGEIILDAKVNPGLVGGFILQVGDRQFDASIANSFNKLKKEFAQKAIA